MAVESLTLEAGRLGKLLLFKLVARGVGYTADAQVRSSPLLFWH